MITLFLNTQYTIGTHQKSKVGNIYFCYFSWGFGIMNIAQRWGESTSENQSKLTVTIHFSSDPKLKERQELLLLFHSTPIATECRVVHLSDHTHRGSVLHQSTGLQYRQVFLFLQFFWNTKLSPQPAQHRAMAKACTLPNVYTGVNRNYGWVPRD